MDGVRDDVRGYVVEHLGDPGGVLIADDTGFLKRASGPPEWLQAWLEERDICYVMAVRCSDTLTTNEGERRADALIAALPPRSWQKISAGAGAHGPREYHWARIGASCCVW